MITIKHLKKNYFGERTKEINMSGTKALKFLFVLIVLNTSYSQDNEIGLIFGGTNYIGDVGPTTYINPFTKQNYTEDRPGTTGYGIGIIYKKNFSGDRKSIQRKTKDFVFKKIQKLI